MANQTLTRAQAEKLIKDNPQFLEELQKRKREQDMALSSDPANDTKVYFDLATARKELGLISMCSGDGTFLDTRDNRMVSSGCIDERRFISLCNKEKVVIQYGPELKIGEDAGRITKEFTKYNTNCKEDVEIVRINLICESNGKLKTVTHLNGNDFCSIGRGHNIATIDINSVENRPKEDSPVAYIDVTFFNDELTITSAIIKDTLNITDDEKWYFVPVIVKKSLLKNIEDETNGMFENSKTDIISKFIQEDLDEDKKNELASFVEKNLYGNPYVNKYSLIHDFKNDKIRRVEGAIEENSGDLDELNVLGFIFPHYGQENIDISSMLADEDGIPILSQKDKANIKVMGIPVDIINEMVKQSKETVAVAKGNIVGNETAISTIKNDVYDAKCKLAVEIDEADYQNSVKENAETICDEIRMVNDNENSKEFINATYRQIGGFKSLADRIQKKIDKGEFSNAYLLSATTVFWKMMDHFNLTERHTILHALYRLANYYYYEGGDRDEMISRKNEIFTNTCINKIGVKNSAGFELRSVESVLDTHSQNLVDISSIPDGLSQEEESEELLMRATARYEFIRALSTAPFQMIARLYPEIASAVTGKEPTESQKELARRYREDIGFVGIDSEEYRTYVDSIVNTINESRKIPVEKATETAIISMKNANEFVKKVENKTFKGRLKKLGVYMRSVVILDNAKFLNKIASGLAMLSNNDELSEGDIVALSLDEKKQISYKEYNELPETSPEDSTYDKKNWTLFKKVNDEDKINTWVDFTIQNSLTSSFSTILYKYFKDYDEQTPGKLDGNRMFASSLGMIVPSLSLIETLDLSKIEDKEHFDPMAYVDGDKKVKFGTAAIKSSIAGIETVEDLYSARREYVKECLKFVQMSIES